ncbi:uncharacterized protein LOC118481847 [Helianthus annuus]|uniref:uncharacterized protein LOC118481847 n=1 Tax=Helianthus annuus TaxID=4232 RepID=UPI0016533CA3|nr:uncharacterized protein LOC118481847 [Helianthus annuus]
MFKDCSVGDRLEGGGSWLWRYESVLVEELQEMANMLALLSSVTLGEGRDKWRWLGDSAGQFSVRSVKDLLIQGSSDPECFVIDWCKWVPLKCNIFIWRIEINRIPTYDALFSRGIVHQVGACPLCGDEDESVSHLLISCRIASILR